MDEKPSALLTGLQIFGLSAFVLAPPILFALTNSQVFFLVHGADPIDVVVVGVVLTIVIPVLPALLVAGITKLKPTAFLPIWALASTLLFSFFVVSLLLNAFTIPSLVTIALSGSIGAGSSYLTLRAPKIRSLLTLLSPVALITLGTFVAQSEIVFPSRPEQSATTQTQTSHQAPVFVIIFDEFSTQSLFDAERNIDAAHFPNFARLARDGTWFRNATTIAEFTINAVPAILTGRYPTEPYDGVPTYDNYPQNLFTLLHGAGYEVFAYESYTQLCPTSINYRTEQYRLNRLEKLTSIFADVAIIAGHLFLPENLSGVLPSLEGRVAHFAARAHGLREEREEALIKGFFDSIDESMKRLYVLHVLVPHAPYFRLPSGEKYIRSFYGGVEKISADRGEAQSAGAQQRYMLMVQYADSMIGRLIDRLEGLGVYDDAIVIVLADHGVSFRPGNQRRYAIQKGEETFKSTDSAADIFKVPLFIKMPGRSTGVTRDDEMQTIDVLPTLSGALGIEATTRFDGRDLFAADLPKLDEYRYYSRDKREFGTHTLDILSRDYNAERMRVVLNPDRLYAVRSEWDDVIGHPPIDFGKIEMSPISVKFIAANEYAKVDLESGYLPALVRALMENCPVGKDIVLSLNGTIVAVGQTVPALTKNRAYFEALIDPIYFKHGRNTLEAFEIRPRADGLPRLLRVLDPDCLYAVRREWDDLLQHPLSDFDAIEVSPISVKFIAANEYARVDLESGYVPTLVRALVENCPVGKDIVLSLNGTIVAVGQTVPALTKNRVYFEALIDPVYFKHGRNTLEAFEVVPTEDALPRLLRATQ